MIKEKDILSNALKMKTLYFKKIEFKATGKKASDEGMANVAFDEKHGYYVSVFKSASITYDCTT